MPTISVKSLALKAASRGRPSPEGSIWVAKALGRAASLQLLGAEQQTLIMWVGAADLPDGPPEDLEEQDLGEWPWLVRLSMCFHAPSGRAEH